VPTTPQFIKNPVTKRLQGNTRAWTDTLVLPKQRKWDRRFDTWNVRSLYRADSLTPAARELAIVAFHEQNSGNLLLFFLRVCM
jgi:hypothetical protein